LLAEADALARTAGTRDAAEAIQGFITRSGRA
jgi:hypothetical protein